MKRLRDLAHPEYRLRLDEYLEYRLLNDPRFHRIVERSRREARDGKVTKLEALE